MATSTTAGTPTSTPSTPPSTGDVSQSSSASINHLKDLVLQLQAKIERLESQALQSVKEVITPAQHLRIVLMGPPGAG